MSTSTTLTPDVLVTGVDALPMGYARGYAGTMQAMRGRSQHVQETRAGGTMVGRSADGRPDGPGADVTTNRPDPRSDMPDTITHLDSRRQPLGTFHAVSCRDGVSLERDGEPFHEMNRLPTRTGRSVCEVCFADGLWLLADPETDLRR